MFTCLASIGSVRCALATRVFAAWLVVLAVIPFTAPFSAFDLAEMFGDSPYHETLSPGKDTKEAVGLVGAFVPTHPLSMDVSPTAATWVYVPGVRPLRLLVLRI